MPLSNTITAFYTFAAGTSARAARVNTNFDNYRGHILPIDPNTALAASTGVYDIGALDHKWRYSWITTIQLESLHARGNTTTSYAGLSRDESSTNGTMLFVHNTTTHATLNENGFKYERNLIQSTTLTFGLIATVTSTPITGSTISGTFKGNPLRISFEGGYSGEDTLSSIAVNGDSTSRLSSYYFNIFQDSTTLVARVPLVFFLPTTTGTNFGMTVPPGTVNYLYASAPSGDHTFHMEYYSGSGLTSGSLTFNSVRMTVLEL